MQKFFLFTISYIVSLTAFSQYTDTAVQNGSNIKVPEKTKDTVSTINVPELVIYPNPAKNKVTLQVRGFEPGTARVKIIDSKGKMIREDSRLLTNGNEDIVMFLMLQPGVYFIIVSEKGKVVRKKIVML